MTSSSPSPIPSARRAGARALAALLVAGVLAARTLAAPAAAAAQVFMTEPEAVERLLGPIDRVTRAEVAPDDAQRAAIARALGFPVPETRFTFVRGDRGGRPVGWVYIGEEKGLYEPITFAVAITPEASVRDVEILVYRESRGGEVSRRRFLDQYRGKSARSPLRLNRDILNITGATVSSRAVTHGVKKALIAFEVLGVAAAAVPPPGSSR